MPFSPKRLSGPDNPVSGILIASVTAGHRYQVTQIHMINVTSVRQRVQVYVNGPTSSTAIFYFDGTTGEQPLTLYPNQSFDWNCNLTLEAGDVMYGSGAPIGGTGTNSITFTVEGYDWYM